ncbi:MAG: NifB/NifX family molybdenum-iron cluster-binding protein [Phycisphaerales bacterium]
MRVAIPMIGDKFSAHFGRCDGLFLCELDPATQHIDRERTIQRDAKGCESLPHWLKAMSVELVLAGGMGAGAQQRLNEIGIQFSAGHEGETPQQVLQHYFDHPEGTSTNACSGHEGPGHGEHEHHHCRH